MVFDVSKLRRAVIGKKIAPVSHASKPYLRIAQGSLKHGVTKVTLVVSIPEKLHQQANWPKRSSVKKYANIHYLAQDESVYLAFEYAGSDGGDMVMLSPGKATSYMFRINEKLMVVNEDEEQVPLLDLLTAKECSAIYLDDDAVELIADQDMIALRVPKELLVGNSTPGQTEDSTQSEQKVTVTQQPVVHSDDKREAPSKPQSDKPTTPVVPETPAHTFVFGTLRNTTHLQSNIGGDQPKFLTNNGRHDIPRVISNLLGSIIFRMRKNEMLEYATACELMGGNEATSKENFIKTLGMVKSFLRLLKIDQYALVILMDENDKPSHVLILHADDMQMLRDHYGNSRVVVAN